MVVVILAVVLHALFIIVLGRRYNNLNLTTEHQVEAITAGGLLNSREARSIAPLVQFPTNGIGLGLEQAKFTGSNQPVTARRMNVGNRGIYNRRL